VPTAQQHQFINGYKKPLKRFHFYKRGKRTEEEKKRATTGHFADSMDRYDIPSTCRHVGYLIRGIAIWWG
jgi:hypothetical protein